MENRVGDNAPPAAEMDALKTQAAAVKTALGTFCITLSADERQSRLKPLRGAEEKIRKVKDLCKKHGVELKKVPTSRMMADLDLAIALSPLVTDLKSAARMAEDTQSQAFSEAWQAFLILYGTLLRIAETDADLESEMEDLVEFMAIYGKRKPSPDEEPEPT